MATTYELIFTWPHPEPKDVIVTGTFDQWTKSCHLTKSPSGFEGKVSVPWGSKVLYKFVVDGEWATHDDQPKEVDPQGNVNNVFSVAPKPVEYGSAGIQTGEVDKPAKATVPVSAGPAAAAAVAPQTAGTTSAGKEEKAPVEAAPAQSTPTPAPIILAPDVPIVVQPVTDAAANGIATKDEAPAPAGQKLPSANGGPAPSPAMADTKPSEDAEEKPFTHTPAPMADAAAAQPAAADAAPRVLHPDPPADAGSQPEPPSLPVTVVGPAETPKTETPASESKPPATEDAAPTPSTPPPPATPEKAAPPAATNGAAASPSTLPAPPSTPVNKHVFPSNGVDTSGGSIRSSKSGSMRKKRDSFFQKIKSVFHHDHEHEHGHTDKEKKPKEVK